VQASAIAAPRARKVSRKPAVELASAMLSFRPLRMGSSACHHRNAAEQRMPHRIFAGMP